MEHSAPLRKGAAKARAMYASSRNFLNILLCNLMEKIKIKFSPNSSNLKITFPTTQF